MQAITNAMFRSRRSTSVSLGENTLLTRMLHDTTASLTQEHATRRLSLDSAYRLVASSFRGGL